MSDPIVEAGLTSANRLSIAPERAKLHMAVMVWQFSYAVNHVIIGAALNMGMSMLVLPVYRNIIALLLLLPFAYVLERKDRPPLTISFLIQFFLLGLVGITLNQGFYLLGLNNTSPTFASATENAVPAVTFLMAVLLGLEEVKLNRKDGIAKVVGTLVSVAGASIITLYKGPVVYASASTVHKSHLIFSLGDAMGKNWTLGGICLIGHCLCWSSWIVLQAPILKKYPAQLSVTSYTSFFSILQFLAITVSVERNTQAWQVHSSGELFSILYVGLVTSGLAFAIQIWVIHKGGPVFFSSYLPVQTLLVAVISSFLLGEQFYLGGIIGAILIIVGLYLVVWGKSEESKIVKEMVGRPSVFEDNGIISSTQSSLVHPLLSSSSKQSILVIHNIKQCNISL